MNQGMIHIYSGDGHGKTLAAWGEALQAASEGKEAVVIQFLKSRGMQDCDFLKHLEPDIKFFRFEKSQRDFASLTQEEQAEEVMNIKNGLNFAKKVLATGGADLLILDEVLGLVDVGIISVEDLKAIVEAKPEETTLIMTGIQLKDEISALADSVSEIVRVK